MIFNHFNSNRLCQKYHFILYYIFIFFSLPVDDEDCNIENNINIKQKKICFCTIPSLVFPQSIWVRALSFILRQKNEVFVITCSRRYMICYIIVDHANNYFYSVNWSSWLWYLGKHLFPFSHVHCFVFGFFMMKVTINVYQNLIRYCIDENKSICIHISLALVEDQDLLLW